MSYLGAANKQYYNFFVYFDETEGVFPLLVIYIFKRRITSPVLTNKLTKQRRKKKIRKVIS